MPRPRNGYIKINTPFDKIFTQLERNAVALLDPRDRPTVVAMGIYAKRLPIIIGQFGDRKIVALPPQIRIRKVHQNKNGAFFELFSP